MNGTEEIRKMFFEQTGLEAKVVSQIGIGYYMIEAEDGNTYTMN